MEGKLILNFDGVYMSMDHVSCYEYDDHRDVTMVNDASGSCFEFDGNHIPQINKVIRTNGCAIVNMEKPE